METDAAFALMSMSKDHLSKNHEHQRRAKKTCADIKLSENMEAYTNQQIFLTNERNKSQFITLLSQSLVVDCHTVHHSTDDADTLISVCS